MRRYYYRSGKQSFGRRFSFGFVKVVLVLLAPVVFIGGILWFRAQGEDNTPPSQKAESSIVNVLEQSNDLAPDERDREEIELVDVRGGTSWAIASRQVDDRLFRHTIVAYLPEISEGYTYEGWLLIEEPFIFFSTGNFQPNADGTFGLVWEGDLGKDYVNYSKVIVTLEPIDGDDAPAEHILDGEF
ncbi:MAG: anti-sigma factor [Patescibacteria group bacterium]